MLLFAEATMKTPPHPSVRLFSVHGSTQHLPCAQRGISLVELMVGMAIGLMTVAVALGALMGSHQFSRSVSEVTHMQQQAAYAFRAISQQIRPAGGLELNLAYSPDSDDAAFVTGIQKQLRAMPIQRQLIRFYLRWPNHGTLTMYFPRLVPHPPKAFKSIA